MNKQYGITCPYCKLDITYTRHNQGKQKEISTLACPNCKKPIQVSLRYVYKINETKPIGIRKILLENRAVIVEDYTKPTLLNSHYKIHYIVFMYNNKEYIYSKTNRFFMLSQEYNIICFTDNKKIIIDKIKKLFKGN